MLVGGRPLRIQGRTTHVCAPAAIGANLVLRRISRQEMLVRRGFRLGLGTPLEFTKVAGEQ